MAKLKRLLSVFFVLTHLCLSAQQYTVGYRLRNEDSAAFHQLSLKTQFFSRTEASAYAVQLPAVLQSKGYITASLDSVYLDSLQGRVDLYLGERYQWARIRTEAKDAALLDAIRWNESKLSGAVDFNSLQSWQQKILDYLENHGKPFGKVYLDSIEISNQSVSALLRIDEGMVYRIDSIRVYGDVRINNRFLQQYLDISNGSAYNRAKLNAVSRRLSELQYLQEERASDLSLLGTGSVLNLYLKPKKNSQVNALIGFLPNAANASGSSKLLLTVDANVLLRNALGNGETIGLLWQQLQQQSPRLNLLFEQPFVFRSRFGIHFSFDMYKRDSSFLNLNLNLGTTFRIGESQSGTLFVQRRQSIVNNINTAQVIQTKRLPQEVDVSSYNLGSSFNFNNTNYRFNPRKGSDLTITAIAGTKTVKRNNQILELVDPSDPTFKFEKLYDTVKLNAYQFRLTTTLAHYLPLGKQSAFKLAFNGGIFQSANYFRNELFQIGGYKLLRGFTEESQFVAKYTIGTVEYRYLLDVNSAFFVFVDGGYGNHIREEKQHHTYMSTGLGLSFETKAGIINLAWAVGKRDDLDFNLRQSKLHLGFSSYF
jgi:outer membrane protein assembly factor BamA